jgi:hypothetical protein
LKHYLGIVEGFSMDQTYSGKKSQRSQHLILYLLKTIWSPGSVRLIQGALKVRAPSLYLGGI